MENTPIQALENLPPPSQRYVAMAEERSLNFLNPKLWSAMKVVAETFMQAGALPASIKNAQQLLMVLQAGYEAGLQPLEAVKSFYFVNGGIALFGEMAITMVIRAGHKVEWGICNDQTATVTITRKDNGMSMTNTFTMAQANARGLTNKDPWKKFPENMLKFKVFHMTSKFVCPDAFHGVNEIAELEDDDRSSVAATIITTSEKPPEPTSTHKSLDQALSEPEPPKDEKKPKAKKKLYGLVEETTVGTPVPDQSQEEYMAENPEPPVAALDVCTVRSPLPENLQPAKVELPAPVESEDDKMKRLIDEEIEGRKLTPREEMEINAYKAKKQAQASQ